jgi:hypothetical protein
MAPHFAVFGNLSANIPAFHPDPERYGDLYGGFAGAYLQTRPWLGFEARAVFLESANELDHEEHQRAVFFGPRIAFVHHRLSLDGFVLGGASHSDYPALAPSTFPDGQDTLVASTRPALEAGGGLDLWLTRRWAWRAGEVAYSRSFGTNQPQGVIFSTGILFRLLRY